MTKQQRLEAWMRDTEQWLTSLHQELLVRFEAYPLPAPPRLADYR